MKNQLVLFEEALPFIINKNLPNIPQQKSGTMYYKNDLKKIQQLDMNKCDTIENIIDKLRALTTNDINESAYFIQNNKKYNIQISIKETDI